MPTVIDRAIVTIMDDGTVDVEHLLENPRQPAIMAQKLNALENFMKTVPGVRFGNDACPLRHMFADGLYIRCVYNPKGTMIVTKKHKTNHPFFLVKGDLSVVSAEGRHRLTAPHCGITKSGTKRLIYANEDTVFVTVHATDKTDIDEIEKDLIEDESQLERV